MELGQKGVSVQVVDMYSVNPIDEELIRRCAAQTGSIVTAEEHGVTGGLGSAVAEVLVRSGHPVPVEMVGVQNTFTESGPYGALLAKYGLDAPAVIRAVEQVLLRK